MRINHNISALNTHNQMLINQNKLKKNTEKLSSGLRINRAGDDAAGLAISEKMRGQIRGLEQASTNSQDGISLIQTAEGALNEIHAILQRQRELAVQAANDTNTDDERKVIKEEVLELSNEINYISSSTEFNTHHLLDGKYSGKFQVGANEGQTIDLSIGNVNGASLGLVDGATVTSQVLHHLLDGKYSGKFQVGANEGQTIDLSIGNVNGASLGLVDGATVTSQVLQFPHGLSEGTYTIKGEKVLDIQGNEVGSLNPTNKSEILIPNNHSFRVNRDFSDGETFIYKRSPNTTAMIKIPLKVNPDAVNASKLPAGRYMFRDNKLYAMPDVIEVGTVDNGVLTMFDKNGSKVNLKESFNLTDRDLRQFNAFDIRGLDLSTVDDAADSISIIDEAIEKVSRQRANLGAVQNRLEHTINNLSTSAEISTVDDAADSISIIDEAIEKVSRQRANLGAVQNRLEHTINNLSTSAENLISAESRIRDVDMAKEMMEMTKNNILQQASQSMLVQANQNPERVLELLR